MSLSKRIRDLRYAKGWGPDELAEHSGLSRTALYNIERERTLRPHAATLQQIARALEVPVEALLDRSGGSTEVATDASSLAGAPGRTSSLNAERLWDVQGKFLELLESPLGEGIALLIEESYRLLPPPPPQRTSRDEHGPSVGLPPDGRLRV
jgi:transcriptional regulator with XRE-family HTH domain